MKMEFFAIAVANGRSLPGGRSGAIRDFGWIDCALWVLLASLAMLSSYHPYFFGDEISPLRDASAASGFLDALARISTYKPRLIFNGIWAWGGVHDWPRACYAMVNAAALAGIGMAAARIASHWLAATRVQIWLLLGTILVSRYSAMIYFDYVSGIIETLSLCIFLFGLLAAAAAFRRQSLAWTALAISMAVAVVLVHERYLAATFALGCIVAIVAVGQPDARRTGARWILAGGVALVPVAVFLVLTRAMDSLPASTGSSAEKVAVNFVALKVFFMYLGNVFLGTNFGKPWFVGELHMGTRAGLQVAVVSALAFLPAWVYFVGSLWRRPRFWVPAVGMLMLIGGLIVMASLPGDSRQEARWMYPVGVLLGLLVLCTPLAWLRYWLLAMILALSSIHWISGALDGTVNVYSSRTAHRLGEGVNGMTPQGRHALLLGMGDIAWEVGHRRGVDEFVRRNFRVPLEMRVFDPADASQSQWADTGIVRAGGDTRGVARFAVVGSGLLRALLEPEGIEYQRGRILANDILGGAGKGWNEWRWSRSPDFAQEGAVLRDSGSLSGFIECPVGLLHGRRLVYRARLLEPSEGAFSVMRLQVNWMAEDGQFISASIQTVEVGTTSKDYWMRVQAPAGAVRGLVYANLHDGESRPVVLESVVTQSPALDTLGEGRLWDGWQWQGQPPIEDDGVLLGAASEVAGFRQVDAGSLDGRLLVYRAGLKGPGAASKMRLQINWMDRDERFLGAAIEVAEVGPGMHNYPMLVVAPPEAKTALVYANLHDGEDKSVLLQSVAIVGAD